MKKDGDVRLGEDVILGIPVTWPDSTHWGVAMVIGICGSDCVDQLEKSLINGCGMAIATDNCNLAIASTTEVKRPACGRVSLT